MGAVLLIVGIVAIIIAVRRNPHLFEEMLWGDGDCGLHCFRKRGHTGPCDSETCKCGCMGYQHRKGEEEGACNYPCDCKKFTHR